MNVVFRSSFLKDIKKVREVSVKRRIAEVIEMVERAERLSQIKAVKNYRAEVNFIK